MIAIYKPTGNNANGTPTLKTLATAIFELTDYERAGKAEGVLRLASWMFGAVTTLETIRNKAEWCDRLAKDLDAQGVAINNDVFTIEHATTMQAMLLDAAHACRQTQASIEALHANAKALMQGSPA